MLKNDNKAYFDIFLYSINYAIWQEYIFKIFSKTLALKIKIIKITKKIYVFLNNDNEESIESLFGFSAKSLQTM
ncbi:hypothetical protein BpHYR1_013457 [Brachionus plicatilis]|uniref:Uncharacterized protein n=1 Tax=Brachionus plicatilis TaxID=10195 RepID=A0A3M7QV87_BRAPC|nr:hypothetical protein BpHYR1_013457 [Brachionus plicatilis]